MASKVYECIAKIADSIIANKEFLTELDREIGDADHGINMARGYTEALGQLPQDSDDIGAVLKKTGMVLISGYKSARTHKKSPSKQPSEAALYNR